MAALIDRSMDEQGENLMSDPVVEHSGGGGCAGVHERTLPRYMSSGLLGCRRLPGGHYRIPEEAIHEFWGAGDAPVRGGRRRAAGGRTAVGQRLG